MNMLLNIYSVSCLMQLLDSTNWVKLSMCNVFPTNGGKQNTSIKPWILARKYTSQRSACVCVCVCVCVLFIGIVQRNWACLTWKSALEIKSLLSLLSALVNQIQLYLLHSWYYVAESHLINSQPFTDIALECQHLTESQSAEQTKSVTIWMGYKTCHIAVHQKQDTVIRAP